MMEREIIKLKLKLSRQNRLQPCYKEYALLKTDEERVKFSMKLLHEFELAPKLKASTKDKKVSIEFRNQANRLYTLGEKNLELDQTIELYTKSIAHAPNDSQELSIAFANRSAALFRGKLYSECLNDINRALNIDYPDNLKAKLLARKAQSLVVLEAPASEVEEAIQEAHKWLEKLEKNNQGRKLIENTINNSILKEAFPKHTILLDDERELPNILDANPDIRGLSSAIEIKYSKQFGRHVVATRNIDPGEIIAIQKSNMCMLEFEKNYTNCSNCLKQIWSGIPCPTCVEIIYCSEKCRQEAWDDHHDLECQLLGPVQTYGISFPKFLGFRICIQAFKEAGGIEKLREKLEILEYNLDPETKVFTTTKSDDEKYLSAYTLSANTESRSMDDLLRRSVIAAYLVFMQATKEKNMFGEQLEGDFQVLMHNPSVTFIGGLIMRNLQMIQCNAYSISEGPKEILVRGAAIMPSLSYFNHSCNPSCSRIFLGKTIVQYANRSIKKEEQIFENYGVNFANSNKFIRQKELLEQYFFYCECIACVEDWPGLDRMPLVPTMKFPAKIQKILSDKALKAFQNYKTVFSNRNYDKKIMMKEVIDMIKYFEKNVSLPFAEFNMVVETLHQIFILRGNVIQTLN